MVHEQQSARTLIVAAPTKSAAVAVVLAILFGPLGMLYATVLGGIVMLIVSILVVIPTLGLGLLITQPIGIVWAAIAVNAHNHRVLNRLTQS